MLKIGVLGAGHLGKIHLRLLKELNEDYELVGFYDPSEEVAIKTAAELDVKRYTSKEELIDVVDVVDIVTPTLSHFECAEYSIRRHKHVFVEKPVTNALEEAKRLMNLSHEANIKAQVGHVERFNPAFTAAKPFINTPMFIETHRLSEFNPRGTDVSVVLDLMIHDLDIVLNMVQSNIKRVNASGVAVLSDTPDICNARLEFDNGSVANLTASRISLKNMRKTRVFQNNAYITIDFLKKKAEIITMKKAPENPDALAMIIDSGSDKKQINFEQPTIESINPIKEELRSFAHAIRTGEATKVTLEDGYQALEVAYRILDKLKLNPNLL